MISPNSSASESLAEQRLTDWLLAARNGSGEALGALFEACRDYLLLVANHELASDIQAKAAPSDLVQQSLTEACQDFPRFTGNSDGEVLIWLRKILLNNIKDVTRGFRATAKRDLRREISLAGDASSENLLQFIPSAEPSPSVCAVHCEEQARLNIALMKLNPRHAEIIRLRNLDYRSFPEIAELMDTTADGSRKLWERAIERLTRELESSVG